jgi:D-amino peptidase
VGRVRHFLLTDLEGVAGVWRWEQTREEGPAKEAAMRLLTGEVNAVARGILEVDPDGEIAVWDGHGTGGLVYELLHPRLVYLPGQVPLLRALARGADALYFVGQHAMAGTPDAPLCHTYSSRAVAEYRLNGVPVGEFGCRAALAGELGIPTVFLSGDDKAVAEARAAVPDLVTVVTKEGLGLEAAAHLTHAEACRRLARGAAEAARAARAGAIAPYRVPPPYALRVELLPGQDARGLLARGAEPDGPQAAVFRGLRMQDLPV